MFGGCGQAELSVESLFFKFICGIHLVPETKMPPLQWMTNAIGKDYAYVARVLRLTLLAPEIVHAVLTGNLPEGFSVDRLKQALSVLWSEQKKLLGIG